MARDLRSEIPLRAFINARIINSIESTDTFQTSVRKVLAEMGEKTADYQFTNPAHVVGLLYCLIVVPKEIWIRRENDPIYGRLKENDAIELFHVSQKNDAFDENPAYWLIHSLRNSVAHADYSVDDTQNFTFWDRKTKAAPPHWEASASIVNLSKFLSMLSPLLDTYRQAATS